MKKKAFTLLELILVIALIGLLGAITVPFYQSMQITTQRKTLTSEIVSNLRQTKMKSVSAVDDQSWGMNIADNEIRVFRGADFENRDQAYDEVLSVPPTITLGGSLNQIIFNKFSGLPNSSGTITVSDNSGQIQTISVSIQGIVDIN